MNELPSQALTCEELIAIQQVVVGATGGGTGVLHPEVIESAVARPFQAVARPLAPPQ